MDIIIGILFLISIFYTASLLVEYNRHDKIGIIVSIIISILSVLLLIYYIQTPTAIDVYKGKTELEIKGIYKDSVFIPTDSTVIYKKLK